MSTAKLKPPPMAAAVIAVAEDAAQRFTAAIQASVVFGRGLGEVGRTVATLTQSKCEAGLAATRRLAPAQSLGEVVELQSGFVTASLEKAVADGTRLSDQAVKLSESTFAPMSEWFNLTIDKLAERAA